MNEIDQLKAEVERLKGESARRLDLLEQAWGVIANANGGNWNWPTGAGPEFDENWLEAAVAWRDEWHVELSLRKAS